MARDARGHQSHGGDGAPELHPPSPALTHDAPRTAKTVRAHAHAHARGQTYLIMFMPYVSSKTWRGMREATRAMGAMGSRRWSIGSTPLHTISALVDTNEGKTRPGQSHSIRSSSITCNRVENVGAKEGAVVRVVHVGAGLEKNTPHLEPRRTPLALPWLMWERFKGSGDVP